MPRPFQKVIGVLKIMVLTAIIRTCAREGRRLWATKHGGKYRRARMARTCLTLAVMVRVSGDVSLLANRLVMLSVKLAMPLRNTTISA